jgi:hypothetical protein
MEHTVTFHDESRQHPKNSKNVIFFVFQAEGLTAIECWVIACIIFVFGALLGTRNSIY